VLRLGGRAIVSVQNPVALDDDTEPEPDLAVLRRRTVPHKESEPATDAVLLLIEVADGSLAYDRGTKLRLYAESGIPNTGWWTPPPRPSRCIAGSDPGATESCTG
jgi:hypothetical protein